MPWARSTPSGDRSVDGSDLYERLCSRDNLKRAAKKAMAGKRGRPAAAKFWLHQERELEHIRAGLESEHYRFGGYRVFNVHDNGVTRRISAAPFRDRVVHHAIINVIEPLFEPAFIYDSYANRRGKGTLAALRRAQKFAHRFSYVMRLDIRKYFPSIDHEILKALLRKKIGCVRTLVLLDNLIDRSNPQETMECYFEGDDLFTPYERRRGIPLGNLTSQFFGNLYLNPLDHFIKDRLGVKGYVRYVDDLTLFADSAETLLHYKEQITRFLQSLRLRLHPHKCTVHACRDGFAFLGHNVFGTHFTLTSKALRRQRKGFVKIAYDYRYGRSDLADAKSALMGRMGFLKMGKNYRMTETLLARTVLSRPSAEAVPPGRFVEQQTGQPPFGQSQQENAG